MNYSKIKSTMIINCYGITKFPENNNYAMVLNHIEEGNLREYLRKNYSKLTIKNRIAIFKDLCYSLYDIHKKDLIHCDLHSGNILIDGGTCYITDLGLCGPVDDKSSGKICGIVPYIAPEVLQGKKKTKESDVYSVGMLIWEVFAGHPPFDDRAHNENLVINIVLNGMRPPLLSNMPSDYAEMMQKCWDADPSKRPTIYELYDFAYNKSKEIHKDENLKINNNNSNKKNDTNLFKRIFKLSKNKNHATDFDQVNDNNSGTGGNSINDDGGISSNSQQIHKSHPLAHHTSRILDDDIKKSKELYYNSINSNTINLTWTN